jgi:aminopeptidase-like protein
MSDIGLQMHKLMEKLFPIPRSITGEGVRQTLKILKEEHLPELEIKSIPSGEKCFDWEVPKEWKIEEAYLEEVETGKRIVDFKWNNLHVVNYSIGVDRVLTFEELKKHLHYREDLPDAIPYVTSYYHPYWGFCLSYNRFKELDPNIKYRAVIKAKHFNGKLNYGELVIRGKTDKEVFFSTYICHPSLANDNLSGPVLATFLAKWIKEELKEPYYTYRFVFIPETIGAWKLQSHRHSWGRGLCILVLYVSCCSTTARSLRWAGPVRKIIGCFSLEEVVAQYYPCRPLDKRCMLRNS